MGKVRNLSEIQQEIAFIEFDFYQHYFIHFAVSGIRESRNKRILFCDFN